MRQKQIIGSHFANAWECHQANELIEAGQDPSRTLEDAGLRQVAEAHQLMYENKHLGKIAILVGAESEGWARPRTARARSGRRWEPDGRGSFNVPWYATRLPRRQVRGRAGRRSRPIALRYGATDYAVYRSNDDRYRFLQIATSRSKTDFERYWYGPEFVDFRARLLELVPGAGPLLPDDAHRVRLARADGESTSENICRWGVMRRLRDLLPKGQTLPDQSWEQRHLVDGQPALVPRRRAVRVQPARGLPALAWCSTPRRSRPP